MTELLDPKKEHKVLEVGTGSGYQAAVLAELVDHVYTLEIIKELGESAEERLKRLGYKNVTVKSVTVTSVGRNMHPMTRLLSPLRRTTFHRC